MIKTLLGLISLVLMPLFAVLFYQGPYNPITVMSTYVDEPYLLKLFGGSFELIEMNVMAMEAEKREEHFSEISDLYGTKLLLRRIDDLNLSIFEKRRLQSHRTRLLLDTNHQLARLLPDKQHVVLMYLKEQEEQEAYRQAKGPFLLVSAMLQKQSQAHWEAIVQGLQLRSQANIKLIDRSPRPHIGAITNSFKRDNLFWYEYDNDKEIFFIDLVNSSKTLMFGPIPSEKQVTTSRVFITSGMILAVISLVLWLWLTPLWKSLNIVKASAREFGEGQLSRRVKIRKSSVVADVAGSFNQMADRIQHLIKTNQFLTNAVAHDLRTPLARLRFAYNMLDTDSVDSEEQARYKKSINSSIDALEHLINQSITYSRYDRIAEARRFSRCCFAELIRQEAEQVEAVEPAIAITVEIAPSLEVSEQLIAKNALLRAFTNLLSNALKHAKSQILITFKLSGTPPNRLLVITVEDDGVGVSRNDQLRIFEPFVQVNNHARNINFGHGFGLAIVSKVAKWHKGSVTVDQSSRLNGASFIFSWPADFKPD